eukprot:jgi/Mesvir1/6238/Mv00916-RA.1
MATLLLSACTPVCQAPTWRSPVPLPTRKTTKMLAKPSKGIARAVSGAGAIRSEFYGGFLRISVTKPVHSEDIKKHPRTTTCGLPAIPIVSPIINFFLSPTVILAIYAIGAVRLFQGMDRTTFSSNPATRIGLTAAWPVLFATSKAFREQFKKAIR